MSLGNFGTFTPKPKKKKLKQPSAASVSKPYSSRKRPLEDLSPIYGDELFQSSIRIERLITVSFFNLLTNNVRISTDFKFAIEWFPEPFEREIFNEDGGIEMVKNPEFYSLYYFKTIPSPLTNFNPERNLEFNIPYDKALESLDCMLCERFNNPDCKWCNGTTKIQTKIVKSDDFTLLKSRVMQIIKYEFFEEAKKFVNLASIPQESETELNETANSSSSIANLSRNALTSFSSFSPTEGFGDKTSEISEESTEEEARSNISSDEAGEGTGNSVEKDEVI